MTQTKSSLWTTFAVAVATLASGAPCAAAYFELKSPGVALPAGLPEGDRETVRAALEGEGFTFLGGHGVNSFTTLRYAGDTAALNRFLEGLAKCRGVTLSVSFKRAGLSFRGDCDWQVSHMAYPNRFQVIVNLDSKSIDLEKLYIPEISNGPAPDPRAAGNTGGPVIEPVEAPERKR